MGEPTRWYMRRRLLPVLMPEGVAHGMAQVVPCACLCTPKFTTVVQAVVAEVVAEVTSISTSRVVVAKVAEAPAVVAARTAASASFGKPRYYRKLTNVRFRPRKTNRVTFVNNQAISLLIVRRNAT